MKIAVCIKRVADSETRVKTGPDGKSLDEAGVKFVLNPYDEFAVEEALRRKEAAGPGEVAIVTLGPAAAQETIRTALAMGADRGVLLQADRIPADGLETAKALAAELKASAWDLILFGKMAIDDYHHQGLNEPRYPALKGIMAAKKKPLEVKPAALGPGGIEVLAMLPPPERKEGRIVGEGAAAVPELIRLLREEAKVL